MAENLEINVVVESDLAGLRNELASINDIVGQLDASILSMKTNISSLSDDSIDNITNSAGRLKETLDSISSKAIEVNANVNTGSSGGSGGPGVSSAIQTASLTSASGALVSQSKGLKSVNPLLSTYGHLMKDTSLEIVKADKLTLAEKPTPFLWNTMSRVSLSISL